VRQNPYESVRFLTEYLLFHFGRPDDLCPFRWLPRQLLRFHTRLRTECLLPVKLAPGAARPQTRALDLGCGVGRFTFELGRVVDQAIGIDNSRSFVRAARRMAVDHELTVQATDCGNHFSRIQLCLPSVLRRSNVAFQFGDAMDAIARSSEAFHIVAAINLICRLPSPRLFLKQLHLLVRTGGQLLLASPFTWMPAYSPAREWLMPQQVLEILRPHFRLARRKSLPFVIREHRRKYQLVVSEVMVFVHT
jgi:SAM-dependent methyltransferase